MKYDKFENNLFLLPQSFIKKNAGQTPTEEMRLLKYMFPKLTGSSMNDPFRDYEDAAHWQNLSHYSILSHCPSLAYPHAKYQKFTSRLNFNNLQTLSKNIITLFVFIA